MDHVDIDESPGTKYTPGSMRIGPWSAYREPVSSRFESNTKRQIITSYQVATWIREAGAFERFPERPVLIIFGHAGISARLIKHYASEDRRWQRLSECPHWAYLDSLYVLTNWDSTLEVARFNLETKEQVRWESLKPISPHRS